MRGAKKSEHNPCPICGLPRGKGPHEFAHGKCIEERAKTDGKKSAGLPGDLSRITVDQATNSRRNHRIRTAKQFDRWLDRAFAYGGDYDFEAEAELVKQCQCDEAIHVYCEPRRPPEIDYAD